MRVSQTLLLELLDVSRMYIGLPVNRIHQFVTLDVHNTGTALQLFFDIKKEMLYKCSPAVNEMLLDIEREINNV